MYTVYTYRFFSANHLTRSVEHRLSIRNSFLFPLRLVCCFSSQALAQAPAIFLSLSLALF